MPSFSAGRPREGLARRRRVLIVRRQVMRLVTFETAEGERRIGALTADDQVVDLSTAAALYLRDVEKEGAFYRIAQARLPNDMRGLFEGEDQSLALARKATEYVRKLGARV